MLWPVAMATNGSSCRARVHACWCSMRPAWHGPAMKPPRSVAYCAARSVSETPLSRRATNAPARSSSRSSRKSTGGPLLCFVRVQRALEVADAAQRIAQLEVRVERDEDARALAPGGIIHVAPGAVFEPPLLDTDQGVNVVGIIQLQRLQLLGAQD